MQRFKIVAVMIVVILGASSAQTVKEEKISVVKTEFSFTDEQQDIIDEVCDESDDEELFYVTTFEENRCYSL